MRRLRQGPNVRQQCQPLHAQNAQALATQSAVRANQRWRYREDRARVHELLAFAQGRPRGLNLVSARCGEVVVAARRKLSAIAISSHIDFSAPLFKTPDYF